MMDYKHGLRKSGCYGIIDEYFPFSGTVSIPFSLFVSLGSLKCMSSNKKLICMSYFDLHVCKTHARNQMRF